MNRFVSFQFTTSSINELIILLTDMYPSYLQEPKRLKDIIDTFDVPEMGMVTLIIEEDHVDKQYRDSYYTYFSQKYSEFKRNCLRLSFFTGKIEDSDFRNDISIMEKDAFIGIIVLRPLNVGSIGNTLLNPKKLIVNGYVQTCLHKVMICGRKFHIKAFPYLTQDNETMTCAETALFNLIQYYGKKYSDYRVLMPSEILAIIENATYERVLPSIGVDDLSMAKVLQAAHLNPRLYPYRNLLENFDTIFYAYVESGIPFILGLPLHAVICIGHGSYDFDCKNHTLSDVVDVEDIEDKPFYFLNTGHLIDDYIFMDDNKVPYYVASVDELTTFYYEASQDNSEENDEEYDNDVDYLQHPVHDVRIHQDDTNESTSKKMTEFLYGEPELQKMKSRYDSILVPLSRRVFLDAERALSIFEEHFIKNPDFIREVSETYNDLEWGTTATNPIVWRIFLASSNSFKDYKSKTVKSYSLFEYYSSQPYPRFIWILEMGTLKTFIKKEAMVEVILDATSSMNSSTWAILSIRYKNHLVYVPNILKRSCQSIVELIEKSDRMDSSEETLFENVDWDILNEDVKKNILTSIFENLYDVSNNFTSETFPIYRDSNLKEV